MSTTGRNMLRYMDTQFQAGTARNEFFQFGSRIEHENTPFIHNGDTLTQLIGLFHIMRGEQNSRALFF